MILLAAFSTISTASQGSLSSIADATITDFSNRNRNSEHVLPFQGVNVLGYYATMPELTNRTTQHIIPKAYYEQSFKIISRAGMNSIRYLFSWESYEKNPSLFVNELTEVAKAADKSGINVIYDNHQYHISSWLDPAKGYGFPSFLFKDDILNLRVGSGGSSDSLSAREWWTNWYNRTITTIHSDRKTDGWTLQAEFLKKVVRTVDHYKSTLGYEILNEPIIYSVDQWEKLGNYNTVIANALRTVTTKIIVFDRQLPSGIGGSIDAVPQNMIKMAPKNIPNLVFKTTLFGIPTACSYAEARLNTAARTAQILGIPLWIGEFNIGISLEAPVAHISQTELNLFVQKFKEMKAWGWSFWLWSFREHSSSARNYNLVNIREGKTIITTKYFDYLKNAILSSGTNIDNERTNGSQEENKSVSVTDTICPTAVMTQINGTQSDMNYSLSSPREPVLVNIGSQCFPDSKILVQGEAYDLGSGIKSVEIHSDGRPFKLVTQQSKGDWSNWSALVPINDNNANANTINTTSCGTNHRLSVRVTDNAGNVDYNTIYINLVTS